MCITAARGGVKYQMLFIDGQIYVKNVIILFYQVRNTNRMLGGNSTHTSKLLQYTHSIMRVKSVLKVL